MYLDMVSKVLTVKQHIRLWISPCHRMLLKRWTSSNNHITSGNIMKDLAWHSRGTLGYWIILFFTVKQILTLYFIYIWIKGKKKQANFSNVLARNFLSICSFYVNKFQMIYITETKINIYEKYAKIIYF